MKLRSHGTNCHELITDNGVASLFSYGQLVAVNIRGQLYVADREYSRTTRKHIRLAGYENGQPVSVDMLNELEKDL